MAFKTLRAAISRSSNSSNSSAASSPSSTASSSATDLSSSPTTTTADTAALTPITTVSTGLTLRTTPTTTTLSSSPTAPLEKTPSRLRQMLSRSRKAKAQQNLDADWHDYTGPRTRFRRVVDPVHRAQLESWELSFGRRTSFGGRSYLDGASPFASPRCSIDVPAAETSSHNDQSQNAPDSA